ncbi:hypothetical protein QJS10_CPB20g00492 [Acorus calamus]|uniref:Phosphorylated adapter RNA export protein n=1 Tax=Acorus calamus TaxID=4465 RepID=A0AAV9CAI1_ACOCL|nr:hypothetical protein QJS10_CPB20g00492 [Acorus calamus]
MEDEEGLRLFETALEYDETLADLDDLDGVVDMVDAVTLDGGRPTPGRPRGGGDGSGGGDDQRERSPSKSQRRRSSRKNRRRRKGGRSGSSITDINRFVVDTCRRLKEKKSFLVWNAVGLLGMDVIRDLVKEVDAIQDCGGQKTADGKRFRTGGGILWNILRMREPKAYKVIMAKGKEFEKQLRQPNKMPKAMENTAGNPPRNADTSYGREEETFGSTEQALQKENRFPSSKPNGDRVSVLDRIRVPVTYDDLFEEGEITS